MRGAPLLHELLHAFHEHRLTGGFSNQTIMNYYNDALHRHCYYWSLSFHGSNSHGYWADYSSKNQWEFFAVTATTYLFGQDFYFEPHLRQEIQQKQPEYYLYLQQLFGPTAGSYYDSSWNGSADRIELEFEDWL